MKTSIKLTALFLLASTGIFAATLSKTKAPATAESNITFSSLPSKMGIDVKVARSGECKAIVMFYDQDRNVMLKDVLSASGTMEKGYILSKLENGDYTMEVTLNKQVVKKAIHVYDEDHTKTFIVLQ